MKDLNKADLTSKGKTGLSREVKNFKSLGLLANGNDERGG